MQSEANRSKSMNPSLRRQAPATSRASVSQTRDQATLDQDRIQEQMLRVFLRLYIDPAHKGFPKARPWLKLSLPSTVLVKRCVLSLGAITAAAAPPETVSPGTGTDCAGPSPSPSAMGNRVVEFRFRRVMSACASQSQVFCSVGGAAMRQVYTGGSGLVLVTGAQDCGKLYTLLGSGCQGDEGLIHRCLGVIFRNAGYHLVEPCRIQADSSGAGFKLISAKMAKQLASQDDSKRGSESQVPEARHQPDCIWHADGVRISALKKQHACFISALMILEGRAYDLFVEKDQRPPPLTLREYKNRRNYAVRAIRREVRDVEEGMELIESAQGRREQWCGEDVCTHLVVNIYLAFVDDGVVDCGQLTFAEVLSPDACSTGSQRSDALKTDFALRQCLTILRSNQVAMLNGKTQRKLPPFRSSCLTQLLGHFFDVSQQSCVVCVASVNPESLDVPHQVRTLRFAEETVEPSTGPAPEKVNTTKCSEPEEAKQVKSCETICFLDRNYKPHYRAIRAVPLIDVPPIAELPELIKLLKTRQLRRRDLILHSKHLVNQLSASTSGAKAILTAHATAISKLRQSIQEMEKVMTRLAGVKNTETYGLISGQAQLLERAAEVSENMMTARNQQLEHCSVTGRGNRCQNSASNSPIRCNH